MIGDKKGRKEEWGICKLGSEDSPSRQLTHTRITAPLNVTDLFTLVFSGMQVQLEKKPAAGLVSALDGSYVADRSFINR